MCWHAHALGKGGGGSPGLPRRVAHLSLAPHSRSLSAPLYLSVSVCVCVFSACVLRLLFVECINSSCANARTLHNTQHPKNHPRTRAHSSTTERAFAMNLRAHPRHVRNIWGGANIVVECVCVHSKSRLERLFMRKRAHPHSMHACLRLAI